VAGGGQGAIEGEQAGLGGVDDLDGEDGAGGAGGGAVEESGLDAREQGVEASVGEVIEGAVGSETHAGRRPACAPGSHRRRARSGRGGYGGYGGPWPCGVHEAAGDPSRSAPPVPGPLGRGVRAGAGHIGTIRRTPSPAHARHNALARRILTYPDTAGSGVRTFMRSHYARPIPSSACKAPRIFCSPMHM